MPVPVALQSQRRPHLRGRTLPVVLALLLCLAFAIQPASAADSPFELSITRDMLDKASVVWTAEDKVMQLPTPYLNGIFGTSSYNSITGNFYDFSKQPENQMEGDGTMRLLVKLPAAVPVGSVAWEGGKVSIPKAGPDAAADPKDPSQWTTLAGPPSQGGYVMCPLDPGTTIQTLLVTWSFRRGRMPDMPRIALLKKRLYNQTPVSVANAESEYVLKPDMGPPRPFPAASLTRDGGEWRNTGTDKDDKIPRSNINEINPSWIVFSWPTAKTLEGIIAYGNLRKVKVYAYVGDDALNPAVASEKEWRLLQIDTERAEAARYDASLWVSFAPIATRGLKIVILETLDGPIAKLSSLLTVSDLGTAAVPEMPKPKVQTPFTIDFETPGAGITTLVVNRKDGTRVANLMARRELTAGTQQYHWNLQDDEGKPVQPGEYVLQGIWHPGLKKHYEMTPYPNVGMNSPQNAPWLTGPSGSGGWLGDHTAPQCIIAIDDQVFMGSNTAEGGVIMLEADLDGHKSWGRQHFMAWTGPKLFAANSKYVFAFNYNEGDHIWAVDRKTHETTTLFEAVSTAMRGRRITGITADEESLYLAINADSRWLINAFSADDVDVPASRPLYKERDEKDRYAPDLRDDFRRLFRLSGDPAGQHGGLTRLTTERGPEKDQHIVLAMKRPVPIGSLVLPLPAPQKDMNMFISYLKPTADTWPPNPDNDEDWTRLDLTGHKDWDVLTLPPGTVTRALRITFRKGAKDDVGADMLEALGNLGGTLGGGSANANAWEGSLDGMKILRRRYANVAQKATIRVSSGTVAKDGSWDAERSEPLSLEDPGIYMLEWKDEQSVRGLAIKEIDGSETEIDVYTGPATGPIDMKSAENWEHLATYKQKLRYYYQPDPARNLEAVYMDGYVDFGKEVKTRAIRLRVVSQWTSRPEGRAGAYGVHEDRGGMNLQPERCRVYGVAALQYLGEEVPVDPLISTRMEQLDIKTGKIVREAASPSFWDGLKMGPDKHLYGLDGKHLWRYDWDGKHEKIELDAVYPFRFTISPDGRFYVFDKGEGEQVVKIYSPEGKRLGTIGTPGGFKVGPWDPTRMGNVMDMTVDKRGQLWMAEKQYTPKRVTLYNADGSFKTEFFDRTMYGGGGVLDGGDKTKLYHLNMEFELNWETGATRLKGLTSLEGPYAEQPFYANGRKYLVTRDSFFYQNVGAVYLYDEATGTVKPAAAMGSAGNYKPIDTKEIRAKLKGKALGTQMFLWSDLNENGTPDADEVQFFDMAGRRGAVTNFDHGLGTGDMGGNRRYEVDRFLPSGVPVYKVVNLPMGDGRYYKLENGNYFYFGDASAWTPEGKRIWRYQTEGIGVHAYYNAKPLSPEQVVSEFSILGSGVATKGDLGEWIVTSANSGAWHLWTADGLLAGTIMLDLRTPGRQSWSFPEHERGMLVENVTAGQEHFWGNVTQTADGKFYGIWMSTNVFEIKGMDDFKRFSKSITVTPENIRDAQEWERASHTETVYEQARVFSAFQNKKIRADGEFEDWNEIPRALLDPSDNRSSSFSMAWDSKNLYLNWQVSGKGPFLNSGEDFKQLFKTGAAVDIMLQTDPNAKPERKGAVKGDIRLLIAPYKGKPRAVLYEATVPGTPEGAETVFETMVYSTSFDRIRLLDDARIYYSPLSDVGNYAVEASIPLATLGLDKLPQDTPLRFDWGVLQTDDSGHSTLIRNYWANPSTRIVSDVAFEAALTPSLWGHLRFMEKNRTALDKEIGDDPAANLLNGGATENNALDGLLKDLDEQLR